MQPKPVQSFARGLQVLEALNNQGSATALALSRETGVPRATVYRLLRTPQDEGYVGRGLADDRFYPRLKSRRLSNGFEDEQWIMENAGPLVQALTERIGWPCDVVTPDGLAMVIRDTTHQSAPLSIDRNMVGRRLPICAVPPDWPTWRRCRGRNRQGCWNCWPGPTIRTTGWPAIRRRLPG